ncbi:MAG: hypothetical protein JSS46_05525 [Proteobacteria bacterium]|nr:hypothetical protein [Pseudomonadota bacterium]
MSRYPPARALLAATLAAALAGAMVLGGCGVKGPLRPAPEAKRKVPVKAPATAPATPPATSSPTAPAAAPATPAS